MAELHAIVAVVAGAGGLVAAVWYHASSRRRATPDGRDRTRPGRPRS